MLTTGQVYSVTVFLNKLETTNNVSIITSSATIIHDDGTVLILVSGQGIDSNNKTYKGLINPNKYRSFGIQCANNPNGITSILVFYANDVFLLLCMQVINFLVYSLYPSDDDLQHFPWFYVSNKICWYPSNLTYPNISAMSQTIKE